VDLGLVGQPVGDDAVLARLGGPQRGPLEREQAERLESDEGARASVRRDLPAQPLELGRRQVRGDAEAREVEVEGLFPDRAQALGQVVRHEAELRLRRGRV